MKRIQFRLDFVRIIYKLHTRKDFTIRLAVQDKEGTKIKSQQVSITKDQDMVDLDEVSFDLYLLGREKRVSYLPFNLYFTVNTVPSIKRKMQLHLDRISQHYYDDRYQSTALQQIFSFEEGEIIYIVTITNASTITNQAEVTNYDRELNRESNAKKVEEDFQSAFEKKSATRRTSHFDSQDGGSKVTENTKLEIEQTNSEYEETSQRGKDGEYWGDLDEDEEEHGMTMGSQITVKESNITMKLIVILLIMGFIALLYDVYKDPQMSSNERKKSKKKAQEKQKRKGKKANKIKH